MNDRQPQNVKVLEDANQVICPQCESNFLIRRHCKSLCVACGYVESCEDIFIPICDNPSEDETGMKSTDE